MRTVLGRAQNKQESKCACLPDSGRQETGERERGAGVIGITGSI